MSADGEYEWGDYLRTAQSDLYAPSWTEPVYTKKTSRCKAGILALVVLFVVSGVTFVTRVFILPKEPPVGKSESMTMDTRTKALMHYFKSLSGKEVYKEGHGSFAAASWMVQKDDFRLQVDSPHLTQRYVLALIFFTMSNGKGAWLDEEIHECDWPVVTCNSQKKVTALELDASHLQGSLPTEMSLLTDLQDLNLRDNDITGTVPSSWAELTSLQNLFLDGNDMEGSIPPFLCSLSMESLEADCEGPFRQVECSCCSNCNSEKSNSIDQKEFTTESSEIEDERLRDHGDDNTPTTDKHVETKNFPDDDKVNGYPIYSGSTDMMYEISKFSPRVGDPDTPQATAFEWLIGDGNLPINANSPNLFQRYVLALLFQEMDGDEWPFKEWLSKEKSECHFPGIGCNDNSEVTSITLGKSCLLSITFRCMHTFMVTFKIASPPLYAVSSNLKGTIPSELPMLKKLEVLDLSDNSIFGTIPNYLRYMKHLETLHLQHNSLTGSVLEDTCDKLLDIKVDCEAVSCSCCDC